MRRIALILVLVLSATALFAEGGQEEVSTPGVTEDTIRIGYTMPMSGPLGYIGAQTARSTEAIFDKYNQQGGIYGRQLELVVYDSGLDAGQALANYRKLIQEDEVFAVMFGFGSFVPPAYPLFEEEGVPWLFPMAPSDDMMFPPREYLFSVFPTTATQVITEVAWIKDQGRWDRLAVIYGDSASGQTGLEGVRRQIEGSDIELVAAEALQTTATSAAVQVAKIAQTNPDMILIIGMTHAPAVLAVREIQKVGLDADIMLGQPISGTITIDLLEGLDREGIMGSFWGNIEYIEADRDEATPAMRATADTLYAYAPGFYEENNIGGNVEHALSVELFIEALKRAGEDLTREGLVEALETFDNYDTGKGSFATFSPTRREGIAGGIILEIQSDGAGNDRWVQISDWINVEIPEMPVE
jgi:ABC-type branched-subunit amino acid transport system substrate-binding protein